MSSLPLKSKSPVQLNLGTQQLEQYGPTRPEEGNRTGSIPPWEPWVPIPTIFLLVLWNLSFSHFQTWLHEVSFVSPRPGYQMLPFPFVSVGMYFTGAKICLQDPSCKQSSLGGLCPRVFNTSSKQLVLPERSMQVGSNSLPTQIKLLAKIFQVSLEDLNT